MRLTRKLSLGIALCICIVLAAHDWQRVQEDSTEYRSDVRHDHAATGRSLAIAVELLWRTDGEERARSVVEELNLRDDDLSIRWVWPDAPEGDDEAPLRRDMLPGSHHRTRSHVVTGAAGVPFILTYTRVELPGPRDGAIELYESLANERRHIRATLVRAAWTTAALIAVCAAITLAFGIFFVARPLRLLADKARRIGAGDLSAPLVLTQRDEIRDVAGAMNDMCDRLAQTRETLDRETAAKMRAMEELRHVDRLRTVGQLASTIAHELGTPLNIVRVRAAMIESGDVTIERSRELGGLVVEQSDRMAEIIRGLLDFARRDPADRYFTDLVRPLRQAIDWLRPMASQRGVTIDLDADGGDRLAEIDPRRIQQVVTNLVLNAIQVSAPGQVCSVRVGEEATGSGEVWIEVRDRGPGLRAEELARIFEPFYTTKPAGEGTGLGLAIADEIVREHGGSIEVDSRPGEGTLFRIRLPRRAT